MLPLFSVRLRMKKEKNNIVARPKPWIQQSHH